MLNIPISVGELFDKITILEIKLENIKDPNKISNIQKELNLLIQTSNSINTTTIEELINNLKVVNNTLWKIEDNIRIKEKEQKFDDEFIQLARDVYKTNDKRSEIKREINKLSKSELIEEKSYE